MCGMLLGAGHNNGTRGDCATQPNDVHKSLAAMHHFSYRPPFAATARALSTEKTTM